MLAVHKWIITCRYVFFFNFAIDFDYRIAVKLFETVVNPILIPGPFSLARTEI